MEKLVIAAFEEFLTERESYCSKKTLVYYHDNIPKFFYYLSDVLSVSSGGLYCSMIERSHVMGYVVSLRQSGRKNTTVNTYFRAAKVFLSFCIEEGYCPADVLRRVKFLRDDSEPVIPLSADEVGRIDSLFEGFSETNLRNWCIVHLMLDAGFRSSEVVYLRLVDINFESGYFRIRGKGGKCRSVFLCPKLAEHLILYIDRFRSGASPDSQVFLRIESDQPLTSECIRQLFSKLKYRADIPRIHAHLLRHTFATSYILGGGNMEFLRLMLGHSDYDVTRNYLHVAQEAQMLQLKIYRLDPVFFKSFY